MAVITAKVEKNHFSIITVREKDLRFFCNQQAKGPFAEV